ncbi:MAG: methyltransferase domain-containing protein [Chloroflexi bacterium]|nr:methyltransferase domain-containing protein [Chloroflexota bacterium]
MKKYLVEMLECPICHQKLNWKIETENKDEIEQAEAICSSCDASYPVIDGIGIFLTPDLPRKDLWGEVDSELSLYLKSHPEHEKKLMGGPVENLSPTDQQFRALVLDERGKYGEAKKAEELAHKNSYTTEYKTCWDSQISYILDNLGRVDGPIVDLASGRCYLVEKIASQLNRQLVATDFSPSVLRRDRKYFQYLGLDHLLSFLAFDARKTPFRNEAIEIMTTNLGLPNIEEPGELMKEIKRIVKGTFLAVSHFFPVKDDQNYELIKEAGIEAFVYKESAMSHLAEVGWHTKIENVCLAKALPTPESKIFDGARADGLPVVPTQLEWCTIRAENK